MSSYVNPLINDYLPLRMWPALIAVFGQDVDWLPLGDPAGLVTVTIIWKEGREDEQVTPGRYSHLDLRHSDLPFAPQEGDLVQHDGKEYIVTRIAAYPYSSYPNGFSRVILNETGAVL